MVVSFIGERKPEYSKKTPDLPQDTDKLYYMIGYGYGA
jgi:hypothetical protein